MNAPALTAIIADDEPNLRAHLRRQLTQLWPALEIVGEAADGDTALGLLHSLQPRIAFLDIRMPALDGLEVARRATIEGVRSHVVFVTAYEAHAIEAFDRAAVDYLLKPLSSERLGQCVRRLHERLDEGVLPLSLIVP